VAASLGGNAMAGVIAALRALKARHAYLDWIRMSPDERLRAILLVVIVAGTWALSSVIASLLQATSDDSREVERRFLGRVTGSVYSLVDAASSIASGLGGMLVAATSPGPSFCWPEWARSQPGRWSPPHRCGRRTAHSTGRRRELRHQCCEKLRQ
jgi:hypothetical protein